MVTTGPASAEDLLSLLRSRETLYQTTADLVAQVGHLERFNAAILARAEALNLGAYDLLAQPLDARQRSRPARQSFIGQFGQGFDLLLEPSEAAKILDLRPDAVRQRLARRGIHRHYCPARACRRIQDSLDHQGSRLKVGFRARRAERRSQ